MIVPIHHIDHFVLSIAFCSCGVVQKLVILDPLTSRERRLELEEVLNSFASQLRGMGRERADKDTNPLPMDWIRVAPSHFLIFEFFNELGFHVDLYIKMYSN